MILAVLTVIVIVAIILAILFCRHQDNLKLRAHLMLEAVRSRDFTFHLPVKGLFYGERAMQEALNNLSRSINNLMARNEVESWQKLTRVLTHEIMNVTTPIQSISQAYLENPKVQGTSLEKGIHAINEASSHLVAFVDSYRKLVQLQEPVREVVCLHVLVTDVASLYPDVSWNINVSQDTVVNVDGSLVRQVILNVVKNAVEAGAKTVGIAWRDSLLYISNDGCPIPGEVRRDIFIPFYTTKPTGSGIGLALSRQIATMQGGSLSLAPTAVGGYHTTFVLDFGQEGLIKD